MLSISLKGHGNEADFLGLLHKLVPHESRTLPFEPFRFWLRIRGDIHIRKTTPRHHRYGESPTPRISDTGSRRLPASLITVSGTGACTEHTRQVERSPFKTFRAYTSGTDAYPEHTGQELMLALHIHVRNLCLAPPKIKVISYI
jgi:hypothetical protein